MSTGVASTGSYRSHTLPRPSSLARGPAKGDGGMEEEDFVKAFADTPSVTVSFGMRVCGYEIQICVMSSFQIYTSHDLDKIMSRLQTTLADGSKPWEQRVAAVSLSTQAHTHMQARFSFHDWLMCTVCTAEGSSWRGCC